MKCSKCNAENAEGAMFCVQCGAKLEAAPQAPAQKFCASCGQPISADTMFCPYCGASQAATPVAAPVPAATPAPVYASAPAAEPAGISMPAEQAVEEEKKPAPKWCHILEIVASVLAIVGVALAALFTLLIGINGGGSSVFYFISKYYIDAMGLPENATLSETMEALADYFSYAGFGGILQVALSGIFALVIVVVALIIMLIFVIIGLVRTIKGACQQNGYVGGKSLISCYFTFVLFAKMIESLFYMYDSTGSEIVKANLNGTTVTGIVLGAIIVGLYCGCLIAANYQRIFTKKGIVEYSIVGVMLILSAVILGLLNGSVVTVKSADGVTKFGFFNIIGATFGGSDSSEALMRLISKIGESGAMDEEIAVGKAVLLMIIGAFYGMLSIIFFIMIACKAVSKVLRHSVNLDGKNYIGTSIALIIFAVFFFIASYLVGSGFATIIDNGYTSIYPNIDDISISIPAAIGTLVCSILMLACAIAASIVRNKLCAPKAETNAI